MIVEVRRHDKRKDQLIFRRERPLLDERKGQLFESSKRNLTSFSDLSFEDTWGGGLDPRHLVLLSRLTPLDLRTLVMFAMVV